MSSIFHAPGETMRPGLAGTCQWLGACERFWSARLDTLERLLRTEDAQGPATSRKEFTTPGKGDDR